MLDVAALIRTLMESTCTYTSGRIGSDKDRDSYIASMRRCYYLCSEECVGNDTFAMITTLAKLQKQAPRDIKKRFSLFSDVNKHYMLGIAHSLDIVTTIHKKYVTGHTSPDTTFIRNILGG